MIKAVLGELSLTIKPVRENSGPSNLSKRPKGHPNFGRSMEPGGCQKNVIIIAPLEFAGGIHPMCPLTEKDHILLVDVGGISHYNPIWLVVYLPLWKMDFVSWDGYSIPKTWRTK